MKKWTPMFCCKHNGGVTDGKDSPRSIYARISRGDRPTDHGGRDVCERGYCTPVSPEIHDGELGQGGFFLGLWVSAGQRVASLRLPGVTWRGVLPRGVWSSRLAACQAVCIGAVCEGQMVNFATSCSSCIARPASCSALTCTWPEPSSTWPDC